MNKSLRIPHQSVFRDLLSSLTSPFTACQQSGQLIARFLRRYFTLPAHQYIVRFGIVVLLISLRSSLLHAQAPYCSDFLTKWSDPSWTKQGAVSSYNLPLGIATDGQGNVYVSDFSTIKKFNSTGTLQATYGSAGSGNGQFQYVFGLTVDGQGNIYVADAGNNRIQKLSASGAFLASYGSAGSGNGQFNQPHDIAVDSKGNMYITDYGNDRVVKLNASGQWLASWGSQGPGVNQFFRPWGIDLDSQGNIYIADSGTGNTGYNGNNRLVKLDASGQWVGTWGSQGTLPDHQLNEPRGVAVDAQGSIYVTDNLYVHKLDSNLQLVGYWGGYGSGDGQFIYGMGVAVSGLNNSYVVDRDNLRVQKFGCPDCANPVITAQPTNVTIATGQSTGFAVTATGTNLTYQWQLNTGSGFTNLANSATYAGVTSPALSVANSSTALNGNQYRVVITSGYCSTTATAATLAVTCAVPVLTAQPTSATFTTGQTAGFNLSATGNDLLYQWQVNTGSGFVNLSNNATYSGVTSPAISIASATTALSGYQYRAIVSSGTCSTLTSAATLTVTDPIVGPVTNGPSCNDFVTKTMTDGLNSNFVYNVFALTGPSSTTVYASTSEGLNVSTDGGQTFGSTPIFGGSVYGSTGPAGTTLYFTTGGGLLISTDNGQTFTTRTTADGLGSDFVTKVYATGNRIYASTYGGLSISTDGGQTFINRTTANGLVTNEVIGAYAVGNTVYAITNNPNNYAGTTLHVSTDGGQTFTTRGPADGFGTSSMLNGTGATSLAGAGNIVYVGAYTGLYISTNGGQTFTARTTANGLGSDAVSDVQAIGNTVYAATDNGLSISTDGGQTFTNRTTANGLGADRLSAVYATANSIYVATQGGGLSFCPPITSASDLTLTTSVSANPVCANTPVTLTVSATGGTAPYSYTWTAPAGVTLSATGTNAISATATLAGVQTFTVAVADAVGSPISTTTVSLSVLDVPTASLTANGTLSPSVSTVTLTATPGAAAYLFSAGAAQINNGNTAIVTTAGLYSVTLTAANGCSATATTTVTAPPDLTLLLYARPSSVFGRKPVTVVVDVEEINSVSTTGLIVVKIARDAMYTLSLVSSTTLLDARTVQNSQWQFSDTDPNYYVLTTNSVIQAGGTLSFGLTGTLTPGATTGSISISSVLLGGSGGESRITNNSDADRVDYYQ